MKRSLCLLVVAALLWPAALVAQQKNKRDFAQEMQKSFKTWDRNSDGVLSDDEIDKLVVDPKVKGRSAAAAAALEQTVRRKKEPLPPLTLTYLTSLPAGGASGPDFERMFDSALNKITKAPRYLWGSQPPRLEMLHQGRMGDCFFVAPLGALLHRDLKELQRMIVPKDGKFEVTFGNGQVVMVEPLTDTEFAIGGTSEGYGQWLGVFEKAYAEARNQALTADKQKESATDLIASGGSSARVIQVLTGHETQGMTFRGKETKDQPPTGEKLTAKLEQLRPLLKKAMAEKRLAAAGTPEAPPNSGLKGRHAYAVLAYDADKDLVTLWNPHGNNFKPKGAAGLVNGWPIKDGVLTLPLPEFVQAFRGISIETGQPLKKKPR